MITNIKNGENGQKNGAGRFIGDGTPNPRRIEVKAEGDSIAALKPVTETTRTRLLAQAEALHRKVVLDPTEEWRRVEFREMAETTKKDGSVLPACVYAVFVPVSTGASLLL